MKYTKAQISSAMKKVSKGVSYDKAAEETGMNVHTLRYYAIQKNKKPKSTTKSTLKAPAYPITDFKTFAREISSEIVNELRRVFRA